VPLDLRTRWAARTPARHRFGAVVSKVRSRWPGTALRPLAVALLGAVLLGLTGAAAGQWIGWQSARALPTDAEAAAIARLALGGPVPEPERRDEIFGRDSNGRHGPGRVRFTVPADPASAAFLWQAKDVRVRLDLAGWSVDKTWAGDGPDESTPATRRASTQRTERVDGALFHADKGDWRVTYTAGPGDEAHLDIVRAEPLWVPIGGLGGGLLGVGFGWLAARWAVRRWAGVGGVRRRTAVILAAAGGLGLVPVLVLTLAREAKGYAQLSRPQIPLWTAVTEPVLQPLAAVAALTLGAALVTVAASRAASPVDGG
jgi:hypothetical protein